MSIRTPCYICGMCEYGYGCESSPTNERKPLCFYRLMDLDDAMVEIQDVWSITDAAIDAVIDVVQKWLKEGKQ